MKRWIVAMLAVAGCGKGPSETQCKQLLDHLVDLEYKKGGAGGNNPELAKQKANVVESKSTEFMTTCVDKTAKDRVECALAAIDLEGVAKCDESQ